MSHWLRLLGFIVVRSTRANGSPATPSLTPSVPCLVFLHTSKVLVISILWSWSSAKHLIPRLCLQPTVHHQLHPFVQGLLFNGRKLGAHHCRRSKQCDGKLHSNVHALGHLLTVKWIVAMFSFLRQLFAEQRLVSYIESGKIIIGKSYPATFQKLQVDLTLTLATFIKGLKWKLAHLAAAREEHSGFHYNEVHKCTDNLFSIALWSNW